MADDGLLLNFAISDEALAPKEVLRGGSWKTRRRLAKGDKFHRPGNDESTKHIPQKFSEDFSQDTRTAKRRRIGPESGQTSYSKRSRDGGKDHQVSQMQQKQVISSLFTSNPISVSSTEARNGLQQSSEPIEPSNAPLTAEQLRFTMLGLSSTIASHLTQKLAINAPTAIQKAAIPPLLQEDGGDALIQAETGSGKTLAYLLPIVQRIIQCSSTGPDGIQRSSGLFAIILAPTRELCKQIFAVLENLLRCAHWIVAGHVIGGERKKSEKARLRKGLNVLVATPGRLADHLEHTEVLDVGNVRWLVLDEGDRLMELGFEDEIKKIVSRLDFRMEKAANQSLASLPHKRVTILCSATMKMDVQRLGEISLKDAIHITADATDANPQSVDEAEKRFSVPAQLKQSYIVVPAKLRLVTLVATLKRAFARCAPTTKLMVFFSCADSVDFHFQVLVRHKEEGNGDLPNDSNDDAGDLHPPPQNEMTQTKQQSKTGLADPHTTAISSTLSTANQNVAVFRLHGSLSQPVRTSTLQAFTKSENPAVLLCTDIASRGLDLPHVDRVVEFDPAFSREEHLHRVGRTARAGKDGSACIFLMPGVEEGYVEVLNEERGPGIGGLRRLDSEEVLKAIFGAKSGPMADTAGKMQTSESFDTWDSQATDFQLSVERWALEAPAILESARRAFQSHVRAYATHVKDERRWFDMRELHLGHLAKAFGLRDRPGNMNVPGLRQSAGTVKSERKKAASGTHSSKRGGGAVMEDLNANPGAADISEARKKMHSKSRKTMTGASEFNLA